MVSDKILFGKLLKLYETDETLNPYKLTSS